MYGYDEYYDREDLRMLENGWVREDEQPDMNNVKEWVEGVMEAVYKTGDIEDLKFSLEELAHALKVRMPEEEPMLTKALRIKKISL